MSETVLQKEKNCFAEGAIEKMKVKLEKRTEKCSKKEQNCFAKKASEELILEEV